MWGLCITFWFTNSVVCVGHNNNNNNNNNINNSNSNDDKNADSDNVMSVIDINVDF